MSTILITGAAGFLGDAIRARLESATVPVLPLDRAPRAASGHQTIVCDLTDVHRMHALARQQEIACIIHCGGVSGPMLARDDPHGIVRANIDGTANLLELARIHGIARFIFCSSAAVYGATHAGPVFESDAMRPRDVYGASKAAGEHLVAAYGHQFGLDAVCLRFSWIYGPRRATDCVIRQMLTDALARRPTRLPYGRHFPRQFVYIDDAVDAVVAALSHPRLPATSYTITGGSQVSLGEVAALVREILGEADIEVADGPDPTDDYQHGFDISAAQRDLAYEPRVTLREGIRRYVDWLHAQIAPETTAA